MPLNPDHIIKYLENISIETNKAELLNLLIKRIDQLCFENCQIDRVACTLTPSCSRRFLLNLRLVSHIKEIPEFCYGIQKNIVMRDFRNKTVVYTPNDAYLYTSDFFDVFFHGDYRKLTRYVQREQWDRIYKIFDDRILYQNEKFEYIHSNNYLIIKYDERIHVVLLKENYALCNADLEGFESLELLKGLCELFAKIYFPDVQLKIKNNQHVVIKTLIPQDVLSGITPDLGNQKELTKSDDYFWNSFHKDLESLSQLCEKIRLSFDRNNNLNINLFLSLIINEELGKSKIRQLRFKDLRWILNFIYRLYNDFYILWL
ncbi:MAG: hypothetical protein ACFFAS_17885 [Promethearchaeota archaeon]